MSRSVYFHIDEVARDSVVAANLLQILKAHDIELVYGNRAGSDLIRRFSDFSAFDLYVFPNLDLFRDVCRHPDQLTAPVIILPTETVGGTSRNLDRIAAKYFGSFPDECRQWSERIAAFCVWGPSHLKAFEAKGPQFLPKVHVVGHPRFDDRCQGRAKRTERTKIRIGIISRFVAINSFDQRGMLQVVYEGRKIPGHELPIYRLSPGLDVEDRIYTEVIDLRILFELINRLHSDRYELIVRGHPRENRTNWEKLISRNGIDVKIAPWDQPYMHWLNDLDHVIGPVSTSFYDCMVSGKKPICTIDIVPKREQHVLAGGDDENPILNFVSRPQSMEQLVEMVSVRPTGDLDLSAELRDILRQEANYPDCFNSLDRIAGVVLDVLKADAGHHQTTSAARLKHDIASRAQATATMIYGWSKPEQSASFALTGKRKRWIDALAHPK